MDFLIYRASNLRFIVDITVHSAFLQSTLQSVLTWTVKMAALVSTAHASVLTQLTASTAKEVRCNNFILQAYLGANSFNHSPQRITIIKPKNL